MKRALDRCRRRHSRYRAEFPVEVTILTAGEKQILNGHCRDLSQAGIGVILAAELTLGDVVSLAFTLPKPSRDWNLRAVIRHRRGYHYGFEFLSLSEEQVQVLQSYLTGLSPADSEGALIPPNASIDKPVT
ncbi:MAG TPA: PilZ domain-containing protein [Verrucomicrobiae bacterium]|nr:PilZ domain-containing protein [Verrucomicrobiae bacterium]